MKGYFKEVLRMSTVRTMENEMLKVAVCDHGAELFSIYDKKNEREVL